MNSTMHLVLPVTYTPNVLKKISKVLSEAMGMVYEGLVVDVYHDPKTDTAQALCSKSMHPEDREFIQKTVSQLLVMSPFQLMQEPTERIARWLVPDWCGKLDRKQFSAMPVCMVGVEFNG